MKPSETQEKIINFIGYLVVNAPPGSGKTYTLTKKIERVQNKSRKKIIALTFSNKAAEELQSRIKDKTNVYASTIHSFCQELVLSRGFQIGLPKDLRIISDDKDKIFVIKEVINNSDYLKNNIKDFSEDNFKRISKFISKQKQEFISPSYFEELDSKFSRIYFEIYDGYVNSMMSQNLIDFDDLIYYAYQILNLEETKSLYKRLYGHLYVDEAQDLNSSQYEIIKLLALLIDDVMLIGDPSQSLYGFMGSSKDIMQKTFKEDFNAKTIVLKDNFRSAKKIVQLINALNNENESLSHFPIEGDVKFTLYSNEEMEAESIVNEIKRLNDIGVLYEDIAILGRNIYLHNHIIKELEKQDMNFNLGSNTKVSLETDEGNILLNGLKLFDNLNNQIIRNYFMEKFGISTIDISVIMTNFEKNYYNIFNTVKSIHKNPLLFVNKIDSLINYYIDREETSEDFKYLVINDLNFIKDNWINYAMRSKNNLKITSFLNDLHLGKTLNSDVSGISLLTVHKSKGLEFDTTFVIGLNEGTLPDYRATNDNITEEDNNAYVAFSRAKRRCYISAVENKKMPWGSIKKQEISRYIKKVEHVLK